MIPYQPNQLHSELLSISSLLPFDGSISASRKQMAGNALSQCLVISQPTERLIQTGTESKFGEFTYSVKIPKDCTVIRTIEKYPKTVNTDGIRENPELVVIYEETDTKKIGCLILNQHFSHHPHFGFKYKVNDSNTPHKGWNGLKTRLQPRTPLPAGTILMDSPAINENGGYMFGRECNVAFMTHPAVAEDGFLVSEEIMECFKYTTTERRVVEFGSKSWPLNIYGDENNPKMFPDIGEYVREDGVLMCLRTCEDNLSPVEMSVKGISADNLDHTFDDFIYVPAGRGKVVAINVLHDPCSVTPCTPPEMTQQAAKYDEAVKRFYQNILAEYKRLESRPEKVEITNEFHQLLQQALGVVGLGKAIMRNGRPINDSLIKQYRKAPLDDWRIEFVIEYENVSKEGNKLTDLVGGKGVVCKTLPRNQMPVDEDGNVVDIVAHPTATFNRTNLGRFYEQYVNAASRDLIKSICSCFGLVSGQNCFDLVQKISEEKPIVFQQQYNRLMRYYEIINPELPKPFLSGRINAVSHMAHIIQHKIHLHFPPDNDRQYREMVKMIAEEFPPRKTRLQYVGNSGKLVKTKKPILVGSLYIVLLEKTGDEWTAVSSAKWQNFGVLAHLSKKDKYSTPIKNQAIRAYGETEVRIITSYLGPFAAAELLDRNSNVSSHTEIVKSLMSTITPSRVASVIDRNKFPLGMARPIQLVKHLALCAGWSFSYRPHSEDGEPDEKGIKAYLPQSV